MKLSTGVLGIALVAGFGASAHAASCNLQSNIQPLTSVQLQTELNIFVDLPQLVFEVGTVSGIGPNEEVFALLQQAHSRMLQNGSKIYSGDQIIQLNRALQPQPANTAPQSGGGDGFDIKVGNCDPTNVPENTELRVDQVTKNGNTARVDVNIAEPQFAPEQTANLETTQQFGQANNQNLPVFDPAALPPGATVIGGLVIVGGVVVGIVALADDDDDNPASP